MALVAASLASGLESTWLVAEGGEHPSTPAASGDAFAAAVSSWFGTAMAGPFPCSTAAARRAQLAAAATAAIQARDPGLAAAQLALGLMSYMAGQLFGPGVATPPAAVSAAQSAFLAVFTDLQSPNVVRANQIAGGVHVLALSTIVVFPPVLSPPLPVT